MDPKISAFIQMIKPNIISPTRATRRYGRTGEFDIELNLATEKGMEEYFSKYLLKPEQTGETKDLIAGVQAFKKDLLNIISKNEAAQNGLFYLTLDEISVLKDQWKHLEKLVDHSKTLFPIQTQTELKKMINISWDKLSKEIIKDMNWIADRELDLARGGDRLTDFKFTLDISMKANLGHFANRIKDKEKEEAKIYKELMKLLENPKTQNIEKEVEHKFKELIQIQTDLMKLTMEEARELVLIIRKIQESLLLVFQKHVKQKLEKEMGLPELTGKAIEKEFKEILIEIQNKAKIYFEQGKYVAQKAA